MPYEDDYVEITLRTSPRAARKIEKLSEISNVSLATIIRKALQLICFKIEEEAKEECEVDVYKVTHREGKVIFQKLDISICD